MHKEFKLRELIQIKNGKNYSDLNPKGKVAVYGTGGLMGYTSSNGLFCGKAVLLPRKGSLTNIMFVNEEFWTVDTMYYAPTKSPEVDTYYLYNYLKLLDLSRLDSGSGVPSMTFNSYYDLKIFLPSIQEQQNTARFIKLLNEKIEVNNKINNELEQMLRTTYDYWFMQFEFPDENNQPYKSSGGAMMYDDKLKRDIPVGWNVLSLRNLISISKNGDWGKEEDNEDSVRAYCVRGADINGLNGLTTFDPPVRYIQAAHTNRLLKANDLVVEISGGSPTQSTGRMAHISGDVINRLQEKVVCSNFCKAISLKNGRESYIVNQYWNRLYESGIFFNFEGKTSGIKNLMFDQLVKDIKIALPEERTLINRYYDFASSLDSKKQMNLVQNKELSQLRDWLLPMLMNGQAVVT